MDMFSALLGPVSKDDELKALADTLRKRKRAADFYSLSTIKPLQAMGQNAGQETVAAAERQGVLREAMARRQAEEEDRRLQRELQSERYAAEDEYRREMLNLNRYKAENPRTGKSTLKTFAGPDGKPLNVVVLPDGTTTLNGQPYDVSNLAPWDKNAGQRQSGSGIKGVGRQKQYDKAGDELYTLRSLEEMYDPKTMKPPYPGFGGNVKKALVKTLGDYATGDDKNNKAFANFWDRYQVEVEAPYRKENFGSAFTNTEKTLMERATVTPNTDPDYVKSRLSVMRGLAERVAEREVMEKIRSGEITGDDAIVRFGNTIENLDQIIAMAESGSEGAQAFADYQNLKYEEAFRKLDEEQMSDEERLKRQRIAELEAKAGAN